jgi:hypothetical protein
VQLGRLITLGFTHLREQGVYTTKFMSFKVLETILNFMYDSYKA